MVPFDLFQRPEWALARILRQRPTVQRGRQDYEASRATRADGQQSRGCAQSAREAAGASARAPCLSAFLLAVATILKRVGNCSVGSPVGRGAAIMQTAVQ